MKCQFRVGDRVRVRKDLNSMTPYYNYDRSEHNIATPHMVQLAGEVVTIKSCIGAQYKVKEDKEEWFWIDEMFEDRVGTGDWINTEAVEEKFRKERLRASWDEWKKSRRTFVWTTRDGESMLLSGMKTGHIQNALALLKRTNTPHEIKDGVCHSSWMEAFEKELQYREIKDVLNAQYGEHARDIVHEWLNKPQKENKENKEDEMSNTQLIENKLEKELRALKKARNEEIKNKFYETTIGKAAKAFNEALEQDGNEDQKEYSMIDIDDLMERGEENFAKEINAEYDAKSLETKEYYAEAKSLFENADTYEQKHEILTAYGILKGPKAAKAKVEVK